MTDLSTSRFLAALDTVTGDLDPAETAEWREAFQSVVATQGPERARYLLDELARLAGTPQVGWQPELVTPTSTPSRWTVSPLSRAIWPSRKSSPR